MSCQRTTEMFEETLSADAAAHLKTCAECQSARRAFEAVSGPAEVAGTQGLEALATSARAESTRKVRSFKVDAALLLAVNVAVGTAAAFALSWSDAQHSSSTSKWMLGGVFWVLMSLGAVLAVMPGARTLRSVFLASTGAAALGLVVFASGLDWNLPFGAGIACATTECLVAVIPMGVAVWMTTRFSADSARMLAAGLSVGCTGILALHMHCPNGSAAHLITFHLLPWLMVAALAVVIRRMLPSYSHAP